MQIKIDWATLEANNYSFEMSDYYDAADDVYLEAADSSGNKLTSSSTNGNVTSSPSATTVADARNSTEGRELSFYMEGIGPVTAKSSYISYGAPSDTSVDDEDEWWEWRRVNRNGNIVYEKYAKERNVGTGTLGDVMSVLTGEKGSATPGLLKKVDGNPGAARKSSSFRAEQKPDNISK